MGYSSVGEDSENEKATYCQELMMSSVLNTHELNDLRPEEFSVDSHHFRFFAADKDLI